MKRVRKGDRPPTGLAAGGGQRGAQNARGRSGGPERLRLAVSCRRPRSKKLLWKQMVPGWDTTIRQWMPATLLALPAPAAGPDAEAVPIGTTTVSAWYRSPERRMSAARALRLINSW